MVKLDILVAGEPVDALSIIVHRDFAYERGKALVSKMRQLIPRQMFEVAIQASIGAKLSPAKPSPPFAKTSSPNATAAIFPANASSSKNRRKAKNE